MPQSADTSPTIVRTTTTVRGLEIVLIGCTGGVDRSNAYLVSTALRDALWESAAPRPEDHRRRVGVVVDLTGLTFGGAALVDALIEATNDAPPAAARPQVVIDGNRRAELVAESSRLGDILGLHEDVDGAADAARRADSRGQPA